MILIPELSTVLILPPRTGSGTMRRAVLKRYPEAMQIYRHMEADGVPHGYDTWHRVGVCRNPVDRLWSLFKFLKTFGGPQHDPAFVRAMNRSVERPFSDWVMNNEVVFTSPFDRDGRGRYWPRYACRHPLPENRKSQKVYLRPDLGTEVVPFVDLDRLAARLDVDLTARENKTDCSRPTLTADALEYVNRVHGWDFVASLTDEIAA